MSWPSSRVKRLPATHRSNGEPSCLRDVQMVDHDAGVGDRHVVARVGQQRPSLLGHRMPAEDRAHAQLDVQPVVFGERPRRRPGPRLRNDVNGESSNSTPSAPVRLASCEDADGIASGIAGGVRIQAEFHGILLPGKFSKVTILSASSLAIRHQRTTFSGRLPIVWLSFMITSTTHPRVTSSALRSSWRMAVSSISGVDNRGRIRLHREDVLVLREHRPSSPGRPRANRTRGAGCGVVGSRASGSGPARNSRSRSARTGP